MNSWNLTELQRDIWEKKYQNNNETFDEWLERVSGGDKEVANLIRDKKFLFGGRILANRGLEKQGKKISLSNCYVIPQPTDDLESIFECAKQLAKTYSRGGGCGVDISNLRPKNAKVMNSAEKTTGPVSFMELYSQVTGLISQKGRRGALMISMNVNHPDIEEFIDVKTDLEKITKANISVKINDEFMKSVKNNKKYSCRFKVEATGEIIYKDIDARKLFIKLCENNWDYSEPGLINWDRIQNYNLLSKDEEFEYAGVNPCA